MRSQFYFISANLETHSINVVLSLRGSRQDSNLVLPYESAQPLNDHHSAEEKNLFMPKKSL